MTDFGSDPSPETGQPSLASARESAAAELEAPESVITVIAALGGVDILAPPGVTVQLYGFSLFGGKSDKRAEAPPLPGSPLIHVRAFPIFGGVGVKGRPRRRTLTGILRRWKGTPQDGGQAENL